MRESEVLVHSSWIDGKDVRGDGTTYPLINPRTGVEYAKVSAASASTVQLALESARRSFAGWKSLDASSRSSALRELAQLIRADRESLGAALSLEVGKSPTAAVDEVMNAASLLDYFAEENLRRSGEMPLMGHRRERVLVMREPVGVVVAITPFNYPLSTLACKIAPALAVGCTVVAKPDEHTPVSTLTVAKMASCAGIPPGVFNVVTGTGVGAGRMLVDHHIPGLITFTGSTEVGKEIMAVSSRWVRKVVLELGGHCPAIVCGDADWGEVLPQILNQSMKNSGQYCYRISRILVHKEIYPSFLKAFVAEASKLGPGCSDEPEREIGPLNNVQVLSRLRAQVQQAVDEGARVELGGNSVAMPSGGFFYPPTVLTGISGDMSILKDEVFGPVTLIQPFSTMEEAVESANGTRFGLAAYLFTRDLAMALEWADRLEAGSVWINRIHQAYPQVPFGGMKESGLGREKSRFGMEEYTELKAVYLSY
ncbi:MAG: aldehyde dehydrogenase family protein [Deltaproteobacteria bacterium]|nr:aldehyde dehydrogenase family protein [Deltaproteobacteria bacterium]